VAIPFIDLKAQYLAYKEEIDRAIKECVENTAFIMGSELKELENELALFTGSAAAIGCSSGTSALEIALRALDIKEGDEVITVPFSFFATVETIMIVGAKPVFVDVDYDDFNIDVNLIESKITDKTKAIIPVSLYGQCANMDAINKIAKKYDIYVIEDGAQSFGAEYKAKKSCNLSDIGTTSFFPAKPLGCFGDGGAIFCSDPSLEEKMRLIANHGQNKRYKHKLVGINGRLDNLQAAILRVKLKYFGNEIAKRQILAKRYDDRLKGIVDIPTIRDENLSVYAQYTIKVKNREDVIKNLTAEGVPTAVHYPIPLYKQEALANLNIDPKEFPITEQLSNEVLSLPFSAFLKEEDQDKIIEALKKVYR